MKAFTAYKSSTGKAFQSPEKCLIEEFRALRQNLIAALNAWVLLPSVSLEVQSAYIRGKLALLEEKGREYHAIIDARKQAKITQADDMILETAEKCINL